MHREARICLLRPPLVRAVDDRCLRVIRLNCDLLILILVEFLFLRSGAAAGAHYGCPPPSSRMLMFSPEACSRSWYM